MKRQERSLRDFYFVLFRHKWKATVFFILVMLAVGLGNMVAEKIYQSEAKLMVRLGRESVTLDPTATTGQVVNVGQSRENEINSEIEILRNRELIEGVVEKLGVARFSSSKGGVLGVLKEKVRWLKSGLKAILKPVIVGIKSLSGSESVDSTSAELKLRQKIADQILENLSVEGIKKSNIVDISFEANSALLARDVVNTLVDLYLDKHISVYRTVGSYRFFREQTAQLNKAIEATEQQMKDLKNSAGMASLDAQRKILFDRISTLEQTLERTQFALAASKAKVFALEKRRGELPKTMVTQQVTGFPRSAREDLRKRIYDLKLKEQELLSTFTENNIQVQEVRRQIQEAKALYARSAEQAQITKGVNVAYQQTELSLFSEEGALASLQAQAVALQRQLADARGEVKNLNEMETKLARLNRELDIQKVNFKKYSGSLEQTRIDQALEMEKISNISVVQAASYPLDAIRPKKMMNLLIGFVFGVLGGIGLSFLAEYQDHSMKRPEDVEQQLQLPVWATIPDWRAKQSRAEMIWTGVEDGYREVRNQLKIPRDFGGHGESLWNNLNEMGGKDSWHPSSCMVTSWRPGQGVTTVAAQLAMAVARREEGRVLLVDANLKDPVLHTVFGCKEGPGLTDMLMTGEARARFIQPTKIPNLDLLACGSHDTRTGFLTRSVEADRFELLLASWSQEYRLVLFDTPSFGDDDNPVRWAFRMDLVIWVIEAEGARLEVLESAKERLPQAPRGRLGVVLNKRHYYIPDWLYGTL